MPDRYPLRIYTGVVAMPFDPPHGGDFLVHAASILSNMEFAHTPCRRAFGAGDIFEAPRDALVTCLRCYVNGWRD